MFPRPPTFLVSPSVAMLPHIRYQAKAVEDDGGAKEENGKKKE